MQGVKGEPGRWDIDEEPDLQSSIITVLGTKMYSVFGFLSDRDPMTFQAIAGSNI